MRASLPTDITKAVWAKFNKAPFEMQLVILEHIDVTDVTDVFFFMWNHQVRYSYYLYQIIEFVVDLYVNLLRNYCRLLWYLLLLLEIG